MKYVTCNLCNSSETTIVEKAEPPYAVVKCTRCGLVYTNPQPETADLEKHYDEDYYSEWLSAQMPRRMAMWRKRLAGILHYRASGRVLDVGCGPGTFLDVARTAGFLVEGTELSSYAVAYAKEKLNIPVFPGSLEDISLEKDHYDVITFWHSLEHVADPLANLKKAYGLLKPGGLLVLACPNVENRITRILYRIGRGRRLRLFSAQAREVHLWHFSGATFKAMSEKAGFKVISIVPDLSQIVFEKKLVDWSAAVVFGLTGKNFGEAIKLYAVKE